MYLFILIVHVLAAFLLIVVVLIQRGRGGGLVESFSGVESMFGTKTNLFLTRTTAVLATVFLVTSISLAVLAARQSRSLITDAAVSSSGEKVTQTPVPSEPGSSAESELPVETESKGKSESPIDFELPTTEEAQQ